MSRPDWGVGGRGPCARDATTALVYTNLLRSHRRDVGVLHVEVLLEGHQLVLAPVDLAEPGAGYVKFRHRGNAQFCLEAMHGRPLRPDSDEVLELSWAAADELFRLNTAPLPKACLVGEGGAPGVARANTWDGIHAEAWPQDRPIAKALLHNLARPL